MPMSTVCKNIIIFMMTEEKKWTTFRTGVMEKYFDFMNAIDKVNAYLQTIHNHIVMVKKQKQPKFNFHDEFGTLKVHQISVDEMVSGKVQLNKAPILKMTWNTFLDYRSHLIKEKKEITKFKKFTNNMELPNMFYFGWSTHNPILD